MRLDLKREHQKYFLVCGEQVKGVTTYLQELSKPALMPHYAKEEREHVIRHAIAWATAGETGEEALRGRIGKPWAANTKRDRSATLGTVGHARIEAWARNEELEPDGIPPDLSARSAPIFARFYEWWHGTGLRLEASEVQLVSEVYRTGGTLDLVATGRGRILVDFKTSSPHPSWPFREFFGQTAFYSEVWEEKMGSKIDRIYGVRLGNTEDDSIQVHEVTDSERAAGLELFIASRRAAKATEDLGR